MSLFRLARRSFLLWFGAGFLALGLVFVHMGVQQATREQQYQKEGRSVEAVVRSKSIRRASRQGNSSTRYEITYRFTTEDGRTVEGTDAVSVEVWERLAEGSAFPITYLPGAPESSRGEGSGGMSASLLALGLGSLFVIVGGVLFLVTGNRICREWRLLRQGQPAPGTVVAIEPTKVAINNVRQWRIRYQYPDHLGRVHEGTSDPMPPDQAKAVAVGDPVTVRFNRQRPDESVWVGPAAAADNRVSTSATAGPDATDRAATDVPRRRPSFLRSLLNLLGMLALLFVALVVGEALPVMRDLDRFVARYQAALMGLTIGTMVLGFVLFMGGLLYRIFGGEGEPLSRAEAEDVPAGVRNQWGRPYLWRVSTYRFVGQSAGSSLRDEFSLKEAKDAWKQGAWRDSLRWRGNFVVMAGALLLVVGLFSMVAVLGPAGLKLLFGGALVYAVIRTVVAFARA